MAKFKIEAMNKIPTAEQLIDSTYPDFEALDSGNIWSNIEELMINFAKDRVKAALEAAAENAVTEDADYIADGHYEKIINKESILNAYPESNIK